jgi:hypothetical protein
MTWSNQCSLYGVCHDDFSCTNFSNSCILWCHCMPTSYLSDLLENVVNIVDVHHLENCRCKSSSVKLTECDHVFNAFDPYHLFLRPCERLFSTKVSSVRMLKCTRYLFLYWLTSHGCTGASELERRKYHVSLLPSPLLLGCSIIVGRDRVRGFERRFWIFCSGFKAKLAIGVFVIVDASFLRPNSHS